VRALSQFDLTDWLANMRVGVGRLHSLRHFTLYICKYNLAQGTHSGWLCTLLVVTGRRLRLKHVWHIHTRRANYGPPGCVYMCVCRQNLRTERANSMTTSGRNEW
jgi:hypothetical protein